MKCLLCEQTMKTVLTFSSLLLLKNDASCLCLDCDSTFERIGEEHCPNCMKIGLSTKCQDCQLWCKEGVEVSHRAIFTYNQAKKDFFSRYKFDGDFLLRKVFASVLSEELKKYKEYQFVVIPLSPDRYANRGFNQVEGLVEAAGFSYLDLLGKREERASSSKNRSERLGTELPFFIKSGFTIPKKILLIDDIYTTGATINRVKKLLEEAGAKDVKTFSLVR
ncbi:ComF family protein [Streptococcus pseudopneumoniae]|uniref:ComF family protein n=1 Tax=Streptococcus pseudopneumoniae TaxID=257758 RepID=UPI00025ABD3C|nr:ComF family protein [Streptococcus pseudopneumoniae]EID30196.1 comF family protein [Streptococcus pseudopneumoniae ATCC BAA-960 = CCUG 49455]MBF9682318.1 ComF family protein [Streptococcus pseudopneumoniae]ORC39123.1 amidophosphoribosyltransferase [Streptococcus pseudopneumoniae ATCC BAA-960 = CCUG 49455]